MQAITHSIPWFLRQPAEAIIGQECYTTLVYNFDILDGPCLRHALSKGLGLGIVLGGAIVKIPQILKITSSRSAHGLSLASFILETLAYAITLAYSARSNFPFSTYGENLFMTLQNIVITLLILVYGGGAGARSLSTRASGGKGRKKAVGMAVGMLGVGWLLADGRILPFPALKFLQALSIPLSLLSKVPQITSNHNLRSTGNLSAFAVFSNLGGCLARIFTTLSEVDDALILWGFILATLLNIVIAGQMLLYWKNDHKAGGGSHSRRPSGLGGKLLGEAEREKEERDMGVPASPITPSIPAKRWTQRKVD